jgi:hypothetical protein
MNPSGPEIGKKSFTERFLLPLSIPVATWLVLHFLCEALPLIGNPTIYRAAAYAVHVLIAVVVGFSSVLFVYPLMYSRGASLVERIIGSYATPFAFLCKEIYRVSEFFTPGESLYYAFSSMMLLLILGQIGLMGISETICRYRYKKRGLAAVSVLAPGPIVSLLVSLAAVFIILVWNTGENWFYFYQEGYKALFMK